MSNARRHLQWFVPGTVTLRRSTQKVQILNPILCKKKKKRGRKNVKAYKSGWLSIVRCQLRNQRGKEMSKWSKRLEYCEELRMKERGQGLGEMSFWEIWHWLSTSGPIQGMGRHETVVWPDKRRSAHRNPSIFYWWWNEHALKYLKKKKKKVINRKSELCQHCCQCKMCVPHNCKVNPGVKPGWTPLSDWHPKHVDFVAAQKQQRSQVLPGSESHTYNVHIAASTYAHTFIHTHTGALTWN